MKISPVASNVLYVGLGISKLQFLIKQYKLYFSCKFFRLLLIKTLDLDRIRIETSAEPQHSLFFLIFGILI
jgi:hypothetical protein